MSQQASELPIFRAIPHCGIEVVRKYLSDGGNINLPDKLYSSTLLSIAARHNKLEIVKFLLKNGANIHSKDRCDETSLHWAVLNNHLDVALLLLSNGADLHIT